MKDLDRAARLAQLGRQIAAVGPDGRVGPTASDSVRHDSTSHHPDSGAGHPNADEDRPAATTPSVTGLNRSPEHAKARDICLRLLAAMPRPRAKLAEALRRREIPDDVATEVLDRLVELRYLDDAAYAQGYVRAKHRDRALGRSGLRQELRRQGLGAEDIAAAVEQVDDDDERRRAEEWVAKKLSSALQAGPETAKRRLLGQLARRGYPFEVAFAVVDAAVKGEEPFTQVAEDLGSP